MNKKERKNFLSSYYLFGVGSRVGGHLNLAIGTRMHETTLTATTSSMVLNEIQRIDVNANVVSERQVEFYYIFFYISHKKLCCAIPVGDCAPGFKVLIHL